VSKTPFKVVFCGLDNSGKTSILLVLEHKFSLLTNLSPTKGIERDEFDVLGYPIVKWDVGGQTKYRMDALKRNKLDSTDLLFYVIDIQDSDRFDESFMYLQEVIEYFRKTSQKIPYLVICLHKMDPDLVTNPHIQENVEQCSRRIRDLIDFDYQIFQTTIYNNWTLRKAFSKGILKLFPKSHLLDLIMEDFLEITKSDTLLLLDKDALIFSETYHDEENYNLTNLIAPHLATMADKLMKYGKDIEMFEGKIRGWIYFKPLILEGKRFYLVIFNKNIASMDEINYALPDLTQKIANTLQTFYL